MCLALDSHNTHVTLYTGERTATIPNTYTTPLTNNSTNIPSTSPTEDNLTIILLLVTGVSIPVLVIVSVIVTITIVAAIVGIKWRKQSTKHNQNTIQETVTYATLMRQEYPGPDASNSPDHHNTMDITYAAVDVSNKCKEEQMEPNSSKCIKNPPYVEETKRQVALEDMYAVVNKKQKKKQNEDTPPVPVYSNIANQEYYNTAASRKGHTMEYEEIPPQIPPHAHSRKAIQTS